MRLAYADPPYPGQSKRHYAGHADYAGEVDHADLVDRLTTYDGWALSTSASALAAVLRLCPPDVRVASWNVSNSAPPGNRGTWWWSWEPVILSPARPPEIATKDSMRCATLAGFMGGRIVGEKPDGFCRWVFALLGSEAQDDFVDLFPGSGAVGEAWTRWSRQLSLLPSPSTPTPEERASAS